MIAGTIKDRTNREILLKMAEDYEERAELVVESDKIIPFPRGLSRRGD